jgi:hypothetical protein
MTFSFSSPFLFAIDCDNFTPSTTVVHHTTLCISSTPDSSMTTRLFVTLVITVGSSFAFDLQQLPRNCKSLSPYVVSSLQIADSPSAISSRGAFLRSVGLLVGSSLLLEPTVVHADVSDGNALPRGMAQFSRVLRLKSDLQAVQKRAATGGDDIGKQEWDNIGRFLRTAYSIGDDMKAVAGGIADPEKKKKALEDVDLIRKYAQAGDVAVSKQSPSGIVTVLGKMSGLVDDFLDSLSDVPDEI